MKLIDTVTGEELSKDEVLTRLDNTIRETERLNHLAKSFKVLLELDKLTSGMRFIDFTSVIEHGYDRTGPNEVTAEESD